MVTFLTAGNLHEKQAPGKCIAKGPGGIDNRAISHRSNSADELASEAAVFPPPDRVLKLGRHRKNVASGGRADEPDGGSANTMRELRFVVVAFTGIQRREPVQTIYCRACNRDDSYWRGIARIRARSAHATNTRRPPPRMIVIILCVAAPHEKQMMATERSRLIPRSLEDSELRFPEFDFSTAGVLCSCLLPRPSLRPIAGQCNPDAWCRVLII